MHHIDTPMQLVTAVHLKFFNASWVHCSASVHFNAQDPFQWIRSPLQRFVLKPMICDIISCYCMPTAVVQRVHSNTDSWHCNECFCTFPLTMPLECNDALMQWSVRIAEIPYDVMHLHAHCSDETRLFQYQKVALHRGHGMQCSIMPTAVMVHVHVHSNASS